jgi:hypothetical protein
MKRKGLLFVGAILIIGSLLFLLLNPSTDESSPVEKLDQTDQTKSSQQEKIASRLNGSTLQKLLEQLPEEEQNRLELGGPPPDGIPSIDEPIFIEISEADEWLEKNEPVIIVELGGVAKAYPMQVLMWHEIVNDTINDVPITVTYCPLCNSAFTFKRQVNGQLLDFGTTGYLYNGALLMYDRQTHSLWAHFGGNAIGGPLVEQQLEILPSSIISWQQFKKNYPQGEVLSRETGYKRDYGHNPYVGYDDVDTPPFLFSGKIDDTLAPKERIVALEHDDAAKAYLLEELQQMELIQDTLGNHPIVLFYSAGTVSGLDQSTVASGKEVGSTAAYFSTLDGAILEFYMDNGEIKDKDTQSTWNFFGQAIEGPLKGKKLKPLPFKVDTFWFAWSTYRPNTVIYNVKR